MTEAQHPKVSIKYEDDEDIAEYELEYVGETRNYYKYKLAEKHEGLFILRTLYVHKSDAGG